MKAEELATLTNGSEPGTFVIKLPSGEIIPAVMAVDIPQIRFGQWVEITVKLRANILLDGGLSQANNIFEIRDARGQRPSPPAEEQSVKD